MAQISVTGGPGGRAMRAGHGEWFERLARLGFVAKGAVYILVGALAAAAAFGSGAAQGSEGALESLLSEPLGRVLLGVIALGLAGYATWRFASAVLNPENDGTAKRIVHFGTGIVHTGLAIAAARMALSGRSGGGDSDQRAVHWTAEVMARPLGGIAVAIAGALVAGYGLQQIYRGFTADLDDQLDLGRLGAGRAGWVVTIARTGLAARGVVFGLIGVFLIVAALQSDPAEARGLGGALRTLEQQPYGPWLLTLVALGLLAYGIYQLVRAKYRRIRTPTTA
jgi:hypothetical protein